MRTLFILLFVVLSGCSNTSVADPTSMDSSGEAMHTIDAANTLVTDNKPVMLAGCYRMTIKEDTATMKIDLQDSTVTGHLNYHFKEKDKNAGTLKGVIRDQYIFADYTFQSEGITSIREVVFRIQGDTLVPGFGDITERDKKIVFIDKSALQFQHENPFLKIACAK